MLTWGYLYTDHSKFINIDTAHTGFTESCCSKMRSVKFAPSISQSWLSKNNARMKFTSNRIYHGNTCNHTVAPWIKSLG